MRRGQVALEYLITYGWGFLTIILIIASLAYFGLLSPSRYAPNRCEFGVQLECVDYQLKDQGSNGIIYLQFRNNFGDDIQIRQVYVFDATAPITPTYTAGGDFIRKGNMSVIYTIIPSTAGMLVKDDKIGVPIVITFQRDMAGAPLHNITGEIYATVT